MTNEEIKNAITGDSKEIREILEPIYDELEKKDPETAAAIDSVIMRAAAIQGMATEIKPEAREKMKRYEVCYIPHDEIDWQYEYCWSKEEVKAFLESVGETDGLCVVEYTEGENLTAEFSDID